MSLFAIGLGLLSAGAAGAFGYSLYQGHQKMTRLLDMQTLLRESQATHFHHLNLATESVLSDVRALQSTLDALRTIHPDVDASLTVHSFLFSTKETTHWKWTCRKPAMCFVRSFNINL